MSRTTNIRKLAVMALLVAVSVVLIYAVHFPLIPAAAFLEYDPADIPILIGALAYGPLAGVCLTVVASLIQGVTVSAGSGLYGIVMHIIATSTLVGGRFRLSLPPHPFRRDAGPAAGHPGHGLYHDAR